MQGSEGGRTLASALGHSAVVRMLLVVLLTPGLAAADGPSVEIVFPRAGHVFRERDSVWLIAAGRDATGTPVPVSALSWQSDRLGSLGVGASLARSDLPTGEHVLSLLLSEPSVGVASASVSIRIASAANAPAETSASAVCRTPRNDCLI